MEVIERGMESRRGFRLCSEMYKVVHRYEDRRYSNRPPAGSVTGQTGLDEAAESQTH